MVRPLPQRAEGAGRGDDRVIMNTELRGDVGQPVRHARAAGDPVDKALGLLHDLIDHAFRAAHFPQDVRVDTALTAGDVERLARLGYRALDRVGDQLLMPLPARAGVIDLRNGVAVFVVAVRVHGADRAHAAAQSPMARGGSVRHGDALATFDQRQDIGAAHPDRVDRFHGALRTIWPGRRSRRRQTSGYEGRACGGATPGVIVGSAVLAAICALPARLSPGRGETLSDCDWSVNGV